MIDAGAHLSGRPVEAYYADASPCPEKVVFQIVGADEDDLVAAAASLTSRDCAGIAWMNDAQKAARLAQRLRKVVGTKSLSMKLRLA